VLYVSLIFAALNADLLSDPPTPTPVSFVVVWSLGVGYGAMAGRWSLALPLVACLASLTQIGEPSPFADDDGGPDAASTYVELILLAAGLPISVGAFGKGAIKAARAKRAR